MIIKNIAAFCSEFEKRMKHESVDETIAEMCCKSSREISNVFGYEF
jgi:hypothetical protein